MALTDVALKNAPEGAILRENGLEFRFYAKGEAGVRFVGRVRGSGARVAIKLGSVEIWDSQLSLFVIQALDGSLCID